MTTEEAIIKLQQYCAYQERCHEEVRSKLLSYKVYGMQLEEVMVDLVQEDFLNEERFARSYVSGKYRIKRWGKNKILTELKRRKISTYCMRKGLAEIEENLYLQNLSEVIDKYIRERHSKYSRIRLRQKTFHQAVTKGYEIHLIYEVLDSILNTYLPKK